MDIMTAGKVGRTDGIVGPAASSSNHQLVSKEHPGSARTQSVEVSGDKLGKSLVTIHQ